VRDGIALRTWSVEDAQVLAELYLRNRVEIGQTEPWREAEFFSVDGQVGRLAVAAAEERAGRLFGWVILEAAAIVGTVGLENVRRGDNQDASIGYWVDAGHRGRGIATRAVALVLEAAHDPISLHRIQAHVPVDNRPSIRVLEKNGFELIGLARQLFRHGSTWQDHLIYQHLASEAP
jgi:ribosomal-protein-alanine N-acetyltransferase